MNFRITETTSPEQFLDLHEEITGGKEQFPQLSQLSRIVLPLPHSNANTERTFSVLRKAQTDSRGNLKVKTIISFLSVKQQFRRLSSV